MCTSEQKVWGHASTCVFAYLMYDGQKTFHQPLTIKVSCFCMWQNMKCECVYWVKHVWAPASTTILWFNEHKWGKNESGGQTNRIKHSLHISSFVLTVGIETIAAQIAYFLSLFSAWGLQMMRSPLEMNETDWETLISERTHSSV